MPQSPNERKAAERERKRSSGFEKVEVWVRPMDKPKVRQYAERLNKKAARLNGVSR